MTRRYERPTRAEKVGYCLAVAAIGSLVLIPLYLWVVTK